MVDDIIGKVQNDFEREVSPDRESIQKGLLSKRPKIGFQDRFSLNASQKYFRVLPILLTCIKLSIVIKTLVLSFLSGHFTHVLLLYI